MASPKLFENLDLWWVYVVHTDKKFEYAQVNQFTDWKPKRPGDFNKNQKYTLRTKAWNKENKYDRCKVYILLIEESREVLKEKVETKRPAVPRLEPRDSDFLSDSDCAGDGRKGIKRILPIPAGTAAKKKKAEDRDMMNFSSQVNSLLPTPKSSSGATISESKTHSQPPLSLHKSCSNSPTAKPSISKTPASSSSPKINASKLDKTNDLFTPDISLHASQASGSNCSNIPIPVTLGKSIRSASTTPSTDWFVEEIRRRDEELGKMKQDLQVAQPALIFKDQVILEEIRKVSQRVGNLEESVNKISSSGGSNRSEVVPDGYQPCSVSFVGDEAILGKGTICKKSAYLEMIKTTDETMWARAFALGVLKEDAHLYGLNPRKGKLKFEENFKEVALAHWTDFLVRTGEKNFTKQRVRSILGKISSRCHDAAGRRNSGKGKKKQADENLEEAAEPFLNPETGLMEYGAVHLQSRNASDEEEADEEEADEDAFQQPEQQVPHSEHASVIDNEDSDKEEDGEDDGGDDEDE